MAHIFSLLAVQDRGRLVQACKYTAHVARSHHVFADVPCVVTASGLDRIDLAVEQRRRTVKIREGNIRPLLQAFCEAFANDPYQVCCHVNHAVAIACSSQLLPPMLLPRTRRGSSISVAILYRLWVLLTPSHVLLPLQIERLEAAGHLSGLLDESWAVLWGLVSQLQPLRSLAVSVFAFSAGQHRLHPCGVPPALASARPQPQQSRRGAERFSTLPS